MVRERENSSSSSSSSSSDGGGSGGDSDSTDVQKWGILDVCKRRVMSRTKQVQYLLKWDNDEGKNCTWSSREQYKEPGLNYEIVFGGACLTQIQVESRMDALDAKAGKK